MHSSAPALVLSLLLASASAFADDATGEQIYQKKCLSCHGAHGEGSKDHPEALVGDRPLEKLAQYIAKTMPEDKPGSCSGEDAKKVAAYIYDAFYSRAAQARNKPPRIELARLTVGQYRNAVADLLATFGESAKADDRRGLKAEIGNGKRPARDKALIDRLDSVVNVSFDEKGPGNGISIEEYSGRWSGAISIPETGEYEF